MSHLITLREELGKGVILICMISTVWFTGNMALEYFFPIYLQSIGGSFLQIGALLSIASFSGLLIDMPIGKLSDMADKRTIMKFGLIISPLFAFVILTVSNFWILIFALFMWGVGFQTWKIARDTFLAESAKPRHRAEAAGAGEESLALGAVLGPALAGFVLVYFGGMGILAVYAGLCLLAAFLVHKYVRGRGMPVGKGLRTLIRDHHFFREEIDNFRAFGFEGIVLLYLAFLLMMLQYMIFMLEPLMYTVPGVELTIRTGGILLAVFSVPAVLFSVPFGRMADKVGKRKVFVAGIVLEAFGLYFFANSLSFLMLILFAFISSVGFALALPALDGLIVDKTRRHSRGSQIGLWGAFMDAGYIMGPLVAGILAQSFGIIMTFKIMAFILASSTVLVVLLEEKKIGGGKVKSLFRYRIKQYPTSL